MKKTLVVACAAVLSLSCVTPVFACTPRLNPPSVKIPDINFKPDEKLESAIDAAAKKFIEKNVLEKPEIQKATYIQNVSKFGTYGCLSVKWDEVENATSYEVEVTKADGNVKTYSTLYNAFVKGNYSDEFLSDGMDDAVIKVKAYGEDETFSLWSDGTTVTKYKF